MSRRVGEEFNVVGLARSPVKRTPRGYGPGSAAGDDDGNNNNSNCSGATTERMSTGSFPSTAGSARSGAASATSSARRHQVLQPMSENSLLGNSIYRSSGGTNAHTPSSSASTLDAMSSEITSKRKALAARRSILPVSRTLKLSPTATADTTTRQHEQESAVRVGVFPASAAAATAAGGRSNSTSSMLYSDAAGDFTQRSITQSAILSALDPSPSAPHRYSTSPPPPTTTTTLHQQNENITPASAAVSSSNNNRQSLGFARRRSSLRSSSSVLDQDQEQPSTPGPPALGEETDFLLGDGDINGIDGGDRSRAWSDSSFADAVFSPNPATPAVVAHGGGSSRNGSSSSGSTDVVKTGREEQEEEEEQAPASTASSKVSRERQGEEEDHSSLVVAEEEISMRNNSSNLNLNNNNNNADTTTTACTPAAVAALMRMGGHPAAATPTPDDGTAASRYRGYAACSPVPISAAVLQECCSLGGVGGVSGTPAAAAALAAMMMDVNGGNVGGSGPNAVVEDEEEEEEVEGEKFSGGEVMVAGGQQKLQVQQQSRKPTPETPSRIGERSAGLPIVTPRRRKAASQLLDLSKATPRHMIRGILGGGNGQQRQGNHRFVPQVTKLVENVEEETPRALLKGVCTREAAAKAFVTNGGRGNSTAVAEAAAAAAAAAARTTATVATSTVAGVAKGVGQSVESRGTNDTGNAPQQLAAGPSRPVVAASKGAGKGRGLLTTLLVVLFLLPLLYGARFVVEDVVVVVCLFFAGPEPTHPIY